MNYALLLCFLLLVFFSCSSKKASDQELTTTPKVKFVTANVSLNPPDTYFLSWITTPSESISVKIFGSQEEQFINYHRLEPLEETNKTSFTINSVDFNYFHLLITGQDTLIIPIPSQRQ